MLLVYIGHYYTIECIKRTIDHRLVNFWMVFTKYHVHLYIQGQTHCREWSELHSLYANKMGSGLTCQVVPIRCKNDITRQQGFTKLCSCYAFFFINSTTTQSFKCLMCDIPKRKQETIFRLQILPQLQFITHLKEWA